jgi:glycogen operon protein
VNFAVCSIHATAVYLCLFDEAGQREVARLALTEHTDGVWHGFLPQAACGLIYGYRVEGPCEPEHGHRFDPSKLLLDPYAKALSGRDRMREALGALGFALK